MRITVTIYTLAVSEDIMGGLMDHDENQRCLDGHCGGINKQGKTVELVHNKGCLGQYETAFDGDMEAIADIMEFVNQNEIPGDLTIHSDAQAAIARVSHTGTGPGEDRAIRVVKAVQKRKERGWRTSIEWVLGHSGIDRE
jgi:hypothetical protein